MFLGSFLLTFSGKGRLILPKKFRGQLKTSEIILMKGIDGGIWGFSVEGWNSFSNEHLEKPLTETIGRTRRRQIFPFAEISELDSQGRFIVSDFLLSEVNLKQNIIMVGTGDHFEIWDKVVWEEIIKKGE